MFSSLWYSELSASKRNLLLLNKADLLTPAQRAAWSTYLSEYVLLPLFVAVWFDLFLLM